MNIAFDIDGVLTDFEWFLDTYGKRYFSKHTGKKIDSVVASSSVAERFGYSKEWNKKFYTKYLFWYARKYPIRENAAEVIRTLRSEGDKVYFVTARALADKDCFLGKLMRHCLCKWLKKNKVEYDGIYFVSAQNSAKEKSNVCKKLNINFFVEDEPVNIKELNKFCKVICMSADYNQRVDCFAKAIDFGEVYWNIYRRKDFEILDYRAREKLGNYQRESYFKNLKKYYFDLPFDSNYLQKIEKNIEKVLKITNSTFRMFFPIRILKGQVPISCRNTIFVCNHKRALDVPMCYVILYKIQMRILTKREFEATPIGSFMRWMGIIFLNREDKKSGKSMQNLMIQTLLHGGNILLFPEGTRNRGTQTLLPFKMGAVYMAQVTGKPIIPLAIQKREKKYYVTIGEKMYVDVKDDLEEMNDRLRKEMKGMLKMD